MPPVTGAREAFLRNVAAQPIRPAAVLGVVGLPNLRRAWTLIKANRGTWGLDGQGLGAFEAHLEDEWQGLQAALKDDTCVPAPMRHLGGFKEFPLLRVQPASGTGLWTVALH